MTSGVILYILAGFSKIFGLGIVAFPGWRTSMTIFSTEVVCWPLTSWYGYLLCYSWWWLQSWFLKILHSLIADYGSGRALWLTGPEKGSFLHLRDRDYLSLIIPSSFTWERVTGVLRGGRGAEVLPASWQRIVDWSCVFPTFFGVKNSGFQDHSE